MLNEEQMFANYRRYMDYGDLKVASEDHFSRAHLKKP
jgi:hypothetical protein